MAALVLIAGKTLVLRRGHGQASSTLETLEIVFSANHRCLQVPQQWMKYILPKGFVAVDGISLTVSHLRCLPHLCLNTASTASWTDMCLALC